MRKIPQLAVLRTEILAGLTVSLALVPEAIAFAFVAGVDPLVGMYAAFIIGFFTSLTGGRPGMISGATGSLAVVMVTLVKDHGVEYLFITVVLMGIIQMAIGALKLGNLIRMVSLPVMFGFVNGLAIIIFLAQFESFKIEGDDGITSWLPMGEMGVMLSLVAVTMAVIFMLPRLTKRFPAALAGILVVSALVIFARIPTTTVGDLSSISGVFPLFSLPDVPFNLETLEIILPYALILAGIGLIESLLTLNLIDGMTGTKGQKNRECIAQGAALMTGRASEDGARAYPGEAIRSVTMTRDGDASFLRLADGKTGFMQSMGRHHVARLILPGEVSVAPLDDEPGLHIEFHESTLKGGNYVFERAEAAAEVSLWLCGSFAVAVSDLDKPGDDANA